MPTEYPAFFTLQNTPLTNVIPFTFREGLTFAEKLERLTSNSTNLVNAVNAAIASINETEKAINEALEAMRVDVDKKIEKAIADLYRRLAERGAREMIVHSPVRGTDTQTVSEVLADMYDNLRVWADFAIEADQAGLTAAQLDERQLGARRADLDPDRKTDHASRKDD